MEAEGKFNLYVTRYNVIEYEGTGVVKHQFATNIADGLVKGNALYGICKSLCSSLKLRFKIPVYSGEETL